MENNENKKLPDISFKGSGSSQLADVLMSAEEPADQADKEAAQTPDAEETDERSAEERIFIHRAELDKAVGDFFKETEQPAPEKPEKPERKSSSAKKASSAKRKRKKKKNRIFNSSIITGLTITAVIVSISIVLSLGAINYGMEYLGVNKSSDEITFNIPEGSNNDDIADILIKNKIIKSKNLFKVALRLTHTDTLYPGDISLSPDTSYPDIIKKLSVMRQSYETVEIVVPEGSNLYQISKWLEKNGVCSANEFLFRFNVTGDFDIDSRIEHSDDAYFAMEGYFFPDTYEFYVGDTPYNVTKTVRENFDSKITDDMYKRMDEIGMDLNEVITLASIVQNEAGTVEDMPKVASVFINRLNDPDTFPTLQSDATRNYIKKVVKKLEKTDTMVEHYTNCYDTYICLGLPSGPICNPGLDAINAVLYPEDTDYYYFCNNLETGESFFAETYKEHKKNLKKAGLSE